MHRSGTFRSEAGPQPPQLTPGVMAALMPFVTNSLRCGWHEAIASNHAALLFEGMTSVLPQGRGASDLRSHGERMAPRAAPFRPRSA
jgi:hypothetical protein